MTGKKEISYELAERASSWYDAQTEDFKNNAINQMVIFLYLLYNKGEREE